jgi:hypothetical protein
MEGHIRKRVHVAKDGRQTVKWYAVVELGRTTDGGRRQKWHGGFRTRKEAEVARAKIVGELHAGTYQEPSSLTLREWVEQSWLPDDSHPGQAEHLRVVRAQSRPSRASPPRRALTVRDHAPVAEHALCRAVGVGPSQW